MARFVAADGRAKNDAQPSVGVLSQSGLRPPPRTVTRLPKVVTEYPLPAGKDEQTHEMVFVRENLLLITQQISSMLVKVALDSVTGDPVASKRFLVGKSSDSGLHGLFASVKYPGNVWATIQYENIIVRLDPVSKDLTLPPTELQRIQLPDTVAGPHVVVEDGDDLWITCKDSGHIVRVNHTSTSDISTYKCSPNPIFVAVHPTSGDIYASLDQSSKIFRLERSLNTTTTSEINIPSDKGTLPVGLVTAPDGNVWFVLLGGSGTFGRISGSGDITWFALTSTAGASAGLIHLAFAPQSSPLRCYLVSSSLLSDSSPNSVIRVFIDGGSSKILSEVNIFLPTPYSMTHRVLPHSGRSSVITRPEGPFWNGPFWNPFYKTEGLYVTEMAVSIVAHVTGSALADRKLNEASMSKSLWVREAATEYVDYAAPE